MTSDTFFNTHDLAEVLRTPHFSLAFIDGLHLFEQALRDFIHLERFASHKSIILLHDCLPLDRVTSERIRTTHFYSGDVWKLPMCLKKHGQDLRIATIRTGPTGLCLVSHFNPGVRALRDPYDAYLAEYLSLSFDDYRKHPEQMPNTWGNSFEAVRACIAHLFQKEPPGGPEP